MTADRKAKGTGYPSMLARLRDVSRWPNATLAERASTLGALRRRWFVTVTLGEALAFSVPALAATVVWDAASGIVAPTILAAGAVEGGVLGWFQARVLVSVLPTLRRRAWVGATAVGAVLAWTLGLVPMLAGEAVGDWPVAVQVPAVAVGATVLVLSLGVAQWWVLRDATARAVLWIWANAAGWMAGLLAFTVVTSPLWQPGQSTALVAAIGVLGGLVMAATMAAMTGMFLKPIVAGAKCPDATPKGS